jgi:regulator of protease activity HflC (stomatin/prohibitin superfamily)
VLLLQLLGISAALAMLFLPALRLPGWLLLVALQLVWGGYFTVKEGRGVLVRQGRTTKLAVSEPGFYFTHPFWQKVRFDSQVQQLQLPETEFLDQQGALLTTRLTLYWQLAHPQQGADLLHYAPQLRQNVLHLLRAFCRKYPYLPLQGSKQQQVLKGHELWVAEQLQQGLLPVISSLGLRLLHIELMPIRFTEQLAKQQEQRQQQEHQRQLRQRQVLDAPQLVQELLRTLERQRLLPDTEAAKADYARKLLLAVVGGSTTAE